LTKNKYKKHFGGNKPPPECFLDML